MEVCVLGLRIIGGAMKEGKGGNMAIDREDFSEEIGGVDEAGKKDKAKKVLAHPLLRRKCWLTLSFGESVGSPSPSTTRDTCLSTWTSSGEPKKSQDR